MAFISLLDDRAKPKGSRDPLGFEMVWTHFGRKVVGNLTTITSSLGNFATALLGFTWAHEHSGKARESERQLRVRDYFLAYEQLAAYLRCHAGDDGIMGITRAKRRLLEVSEDETQEIALGAGMELQILSDQASYGLWGLYSTALRDTGLVKGDDREPTEKGRTIAKQIREHFGHPNWMNKVLLDRRSVTIGELGEYASTFVTAIRHKSVQTLLQAELLTGGARHALQGKLWEATQDIGISTIQSGDLSGYILKVLDRLRTARQGHADLCKCLEDILRIERLLVAANNIFHYCRRKDGETLANIVANVNKRGYSYDHLPVEEDMPRLVGQLRRGGALLKLCSALRKLDHGRALHLVLKLNRDVMRQRGGAPWVEIEDRGTLRVRVKSERAELCKQHHLETYWDYDYFLGSFLQIAKETTAVSVDG